VYEKKKEIREKYLKMPPGWILGTIKKELNLYAFDDDMLEDLQDHTKTTLAYWRQNRRQYPLAWLWDIFYYHLLLKSFKSRYKLQDWCKARLRRLNDLVYVEKQ
jgi:hypothetical protein